MTSYIVDVRCPRCGKVHRRSNHFLIDNGPTQPGSLADLYSGAELPRALVSLLDDLTWCPVTEKWINQRDRRRVLLMPHRR